MSCATLLFPRIDLYEDDYFGDHSTMSFESAVDAAWTLFKQWKQRKKISCSQPKFSASSAPGIKLECVRKPHVHTLRTFFNCKVFSGREADWSLKAYNGRVVNAFLADLCLEHARRRGTEHSWLVAECMSSSQSVTSFIVWPVSIQTSTLLDLGLWPSLLPGPVPTSCKRSWKRLEGTCSLVQTSQLVECNRLNRKSKRGLSFSIAPTESHDVRFD